MPRQRPRAGELATDGGFSIEVVWTDWQAPGKVDNADNAVTFSARDFTLTGEARTTGEGGAGADPDLRRPRGAGPRGPLPTGRTATSSCAGDCASSTRRTAATTSSAVEPRRRAADRQRPRSRAGGSASPSPCHAPRGGAFVGLEWPAADNRIERADGTTRVRCGDVMGEMIGPRGGRRGETSVLAVTPDSRVKGWFLAYLDTIRAGKLRPYTLYNSWYDLRSAEYPRVAPDHVMNEENVLRIARLLREQHGGEARDHPRRLRPRRRLGRLPERLGAAAGAVPARPGADRRRARRRRARASGSGSARPAATPSARSASAGCASTATRPAGDQMWVGGPQLRGAARDAAPTDLVTRRASATSSGTGSSSSPPGRGSARRRGSTRGGRSSQTRRKPGLRASARSTPTCSSTSPPAPGCRPGGCASPTRSGWAARTTARPTSRRSRPATPSITYRDLVLYEDFRDQRLLVPDRQPDDPRRAQGDDRRRGDRPRRVPRHVISELLFELWPRSPSLETPTLTNIFATSGMEAIVRSACCVT